MRRLTELIRNQSGAAAHGVIRVDSFLNHQVHPDLMLDIGRELATRLAVTHPTKVLTVEAGGIPAAFATAAALHIPLVIARKHRAPGMPRVLLTESTLSQTTNQAVDLFVSPEFLGEGDRVILVDDFLTNAQRMLALSRLVASGGARTVGIGAVLEKTLEGGRAALAELDVPVEALVRLGTIETANVQILDS